MGHNIDLSWLLGLPKSLRCPRCKELAPSGFDEYDVDCGEPQAQDGVMTLDVQCRHCRHDFEFRVRIAFDAETKQEARK